MRLSRVRLLLLAAAVLLFSAAAALAQTGHGGSTIRVVVTGAPSGPTVVSIKHDPGSPAEPVARVERTGIAALRQIVPGSCELLVTPEGRAPVSMSVDLHPDEIVTFEARYDGSDPPAVRLVDRAPVGSGTTFAQSDLGAIPSGKDISALVEAAVPFVVGDRIDNGGLSTGAWARIGSRGASWTDNVVVIGDLRTTNSTMSRAWSFLPEIATAGSVSVFAGGLDARFDTPGAAVIVRPMRSRSSWWRSIDVSATTPGMVSATSGSTPPIARVDEFQRAGIEVAGPVTSRVGLLVAASQQRARAFDRRLVAGAPSVESSSAASLRATTFFASAIGRRGDRDQIRVQGGGQQLEHPFAGAVQFQSRDSTERDTFGHATFAWDRARIDGSQTEYAVSYERAIVTPRLGDTTGGVTDRILDGPLPLAASKDERSRVNGRAEIDLKPFGRAVQHFVRAGLDLDYASMTAHVLAAPTFGELVYGLPSRIWVPAIPQADSRRHVFTTAGFASDQIAFSSHVTLDLGVRVQASSGAASGSSGASWIGAMPRATLRWGGPAGAITASYGRYQPRLPLAYMAYGDPNGSLASVYRWSPLFRDVRFDSSVPNAVVAYAGTNATIASIDDHLKAPRTDEYAFTAETPLGRTMRARATAVVRRTSDLVRVVNVGAPLSSYRPVQTFDAGPDDTGAAAGLVTIYERLPATFGQDRYLVTNPADDRASFGGVEVAWELRTAHWWSEAGVMAYHTAGSGGNRGAGADENDQGVLGERFVTPNATPVGDARLFFDRSYVLNWSTSYRPGRGFLAAFTARYQDGQPFGRLVVGPGLAQGADYITVEQVGHTRFTFLATIDTRLEKSFAWGRQGEFAVTFDAFNITNRANEVEEDVVAGATFRDTTAVQPPRTLRLGLRVRF